MSYSPDHRLSSHRELATSASLCSSPSFPPVLSPFREPRSRNSYGGHSSYPCPCTPRLTRISTVLPQIQTLCQTTIAPLTVATSIFTIPPPVLPPPHSHQYPPTPTSFYESGRSPRTSYAPKMEYSHSQSSQEGTHSPVRLPPASALIREVDASSAPYHSRPGPPHHSHSLHRPVPPPSGPLPTSRPSPASSAAPLESAPRQARTRYNKEYTPEQIHFVMYTFVDCAKNWDQTLELFRAEFNDERGAAGLQGVFYRENKIFPVTNAEGLLQWDHKNEKWATKDLPMRNHGDGKIGLLDRYPDAAISYSWVSDEHKRRVWDIGMRHRQQRLDMLYWQRERTGMAAPHNSSNMSYASQVFGHRH